MLVLNTRMLVPAYELMFGKPSLHRLFEGYFDQAGRVNARGHFEDVARSSC